MKGKRDISNREDIILMVDSFYEKVQRNEELNHVFNEVAKLNWKKHLPKMYDFWESVVFRNPVYKGNPMEIHKQLHSKLPLSKAMFDKWLTLFNENIDELFEGDLARDAKTRALSIATMIQMKTVYAK